MKWKLIKSTNLNTVNVSTTIRVSDQTRDRFARMAAATGRLMIVLLEEVADALERRIFFTQLSSRFSQLQEDAEAWAEIQDERRHESVSLGDDSE